MSGETETLPSGWTTDTLKILLDEKIAAVQNSAAAEAQRLADKIEALEDIVNLGVETSKLAQDKFEATVERDSVKQNEFRGSLDDLGKNMATRREMEAAMVSINIRLDDFGKQLADFRSRIDIGPAALGALQSRVDVGAGRQQGVRLTSGLFFSSIAAFAAVISIVVVLANVLAK